jgi:hypothetical protein
MQVASHGCNMLQLFVFSGLTTIKKLILAANLTFNLWKCSLAANMGRKNLGNPAVLKSEMPAIIVPHCFINYPLAHKTSAQLKALKKKLQQKLLYSM